MSLAHEFFGEPGTYPLRATIGARGNELPRAAQSGQFSMSSTNSLRNLFPKFHYQSHGNVKTNYFRASAIPARCIDNR